MTRNEFTIGLRFLCRVHFDTVRRMHITRSPYREYLVLVIVLVRL